MKGPEHQRPSESGLAPEVHRQRVPQQGPVTGVTNNELVEPSKAERAGEPKANPAARNVVGDRITDRAMTPTGPDAERAVKLNSWPCLAWPQAVLLP